MKKTMTMAIAIAMAATMAHAATITSVADGNWTNVATWGGTLPGAADLARVNAHTITVDSTADAINKLQMARSGASTLNILSSGLLSVTDADLGHRYATTVVVDGGTLNVGNTFKVGNGGASYPGATGQFTINNGGTVSILGASFVGARESDGSLTLNSGTFSALNLTLGDDDAVTTASVNLLGGLMTLTSGTLNIVSTNTGSALLNIENDAQMILGGNKLGNIDAYVTDGDITWANGDAGDTAVGDQTWASGTDYLHAEFDGTDTTVWVNKTIPEPATLGLVGFTGMAMLFARRRLRKK